MALPFDVARANSFGIGSPYQSVSELMVPDPVNSSCSILDRSRASITWGQLPKAFLNIKSFQNANGPGCSGWGMDWSLLPSLLGPCILWFLAFMMMRYWCREPLARFGVYMGIVTENAKHHRRRLAEGKRGSQALSAKNQKEIFKFQNQLWLACFYVISSCFGYYVQREKPWFTFPLNDVSAASLLVPHPYNPTKEILFYYQYGLAFYLAELVSLTFLETAVKRSDFLEYVFHHLVTVALIVFSHIGWEHRFGAYVLFIHDTSDIMLCFSKSLHYMINPEVQRVASAKRRGERYRSPWVFRFVLRENLANGCFAVFTASFVFMRLYCLPMVTRATFGMAPLLRHGNVNMWLLVMLLNIFLQALHLYWGLLIALMILTLFTGGERKDLRSGSESDEESPDYVPWDETMTHEGEAPLWKSY